MTTSEYNDCVDRHSNGVYRFVLKNLNDEEKARDVVQDSYEKMWIKRHDVEGAKARAYLFTTAYHTMIDYLRRERHLVQMSEDNTPSAGYRNDYTGLKEILDEAVQRLPDIQRSVVLLRDYEGYSYQEIGQITGLSESQVKVYIFRARVALKNYIGSLDAVI
ncbi:MAG TPA: RNA polymerase sigma factor [Bacteroidales bacterium]|nr:RNA polymerase sigma factor [Bacteroidales bacterium]